MCGCFDFNIIHCRCEHTIAHFRQKAPPTMSQLEYSFQAGAQSQFMVKVLIGHYNSQIIVKNFPSSLSMMVILDTRLYFILDTCSRQGMGRIINRKEGWGSARDQRR